jgi:hypothetical protein
MRLIKTNTGNPGRAFTLLFMLLCWLPCPAFPQSGDETGHGDISISRMKFEYQYYGFPFEIRGGYFYRHNNFSLYPNTGLRLSSDDGISGNAIGGLKLAFKNVEWSPEFHYQLLPFLRGDHLYRFENTLAFRLPAVSVGVVNSWGKELWYRQKESPAAEDALVQGLSFDFFLIDRGIVRGTAMSSLKINYLPNEGYFDYAARLDTPVTFSLYHFDISAIFSLFYTDELEIPGTNPEGKFIIEKTYAYVTGRMGTDTGPAYKLINSFELELRWYFLRTSVPTSKIFVSAFGNLGLGINKNDDGFFVYQAGLGFGYNLFDSVPFTFQVGIDNNNKLIFYTGVISRISHRP